CRVVAHEPEHGADPQGMDVFGQDLEHRHDPTVVHVVSLLAWLQRLWPGSMPGIKRCPRSTRIVPRPRLYWSADGVALQVPRRRYDRGPPRQDTELTTSCAEIRWAGCRSAELVVPDVVGLQPRLPQQPSQRGIDHGGRPRHVGARIREAVLH